MQLIRKVDWFDGTGRAGQQSAVVCEGVRDQVDIYASQPSFNNNIKGSVEEPFSGLSTRTQPKLDYRDFLWIDFCFLLSCLCSK